MNSGPRQTDIFIAEDNPADIRLIEEALRDMTPRPALEIVCDGEQVLKCLIDRLRTAPPLLLLDFHLPKVDSREVLKRLRQQERLRNTAVVVISTSEVEEVIHEAYSLGADCYLSKPSDLDEFLSTIRHAAQYWLGLQRASATVSKIV